MKQIFTLAILLFTFSINAQQPVMVDKADANEDIDFLVQKLKEVHYNPYSFFDEETFDQKVLELKKEWGDQDQISLRKFSSTAIKIAAMVSQGNTKVEWQNAKLFPELGAYGFIPFKIQKIDGKFKCTYTLDKEVKKGAEIISINGNPIVDLYNDLLTYSGGHAGFKSVFAQNFLPIYLFLNDIGAPYLIELEEGEIGYIPNGLNLVDVSILLTSDIPTSQYDFRILDQTIGYINFNSAISLDSFDLFLKNSFQEIQSNDIDKLIIDIRRNAGVNPKCFEMIVPYLSKNKYKLNSGRIWKVSEEMKQRVQDSAYVEAFGEKFIKKYMKAENSTLLDNFSKKKIKPGKTDLLFEGQSCILIGPGTRSSANSFADGVKAYQLSILLGKPTVVTSNYFGELIELKLPNSENLFYVSSTLELGPLGELESNNVITPNINAKGDALIEAMKWLKQLN